MEIDLTLKLDFLIELAKACLISNDILEVVGGNFNYSMLPGKENEPYKHIFKYLIDYHRAHKRPPSIGLLAQNIQSQDALGVIGKIREINVHDQKGQIIETLEVFIRKAKFMDMHIRAKETFNAGKYDDAINEMAKTSAEINAFSLKRKMHSRIFHDFDRIITEAQDRDNRAMQKIPTGIPPLDCHIRGGLERGAALLGIGESGIGKSLFLRSLGFHAAFRGFNVFHVSAEGKKSDLEQAYTAGWAGIDLHSFNDGEFTDVDWKKIERSRQSYLAQCGEIYTHAFEQFHNASVMDVRKLLIDLMKDVDIHLVIFDYLEKFEPGDGKKYSTGDDGNRARKLATAEKIVNIGTEFNVACATFTQATNIDRALKNNPNFVLTRNNISNLKATIDPFAYCITLNQTDSENDNEVIRIYEEKFRKYKIYSHSRTYSIVQDRAKSKFIDVAETKKRFWDDEKKQVINNIPKKADEVKSKPIRKPIN